MHLTWIFFLGFWGLQIFLRFQEEVQNKINLSSWNGSHKLPIITFGVIQKPLWIEASKWSSDGSIKKNFWIYPEKDMVTSSLSFLVLITVSIKRDCVQKQNWG